MSEGQLPMTGDSFMVTLNEQDELPHKFVAVQVTAVVPVTNVEPDVGIQDIDAAGVAVDEGEE